MSCHLKDEDIENLPQDKVMLLRAVAEMCDGIKKISKPHGRSEWDFMFDEGVYQGQSHYSIRQDHLSPMTIIFMLQSIGWPGFKSMYKQANELLRPMLLAKIPAQPPSEPSQAGEGL